MTEILSIQALRVYPKNNTQHVLVNNINLSLHSGKTTCIVGESGSGKSLTALSIMGLLSKQLTADGQIVFKGNTLNTDDNTSMQKIRGAEIGMIFQEPMTSLNPVLTIGYQIEEPLVIHKALSGEPLKAKVTQLLHLVGIPEDRYNSYPDELSGGQRQRVMIAMSIACEPALLIADEPTTALDVTVQAQVLTLLNDLKQRLNMAMLFITHDFGVVSDIADDVVVMFRGKIVEYGSTSQVLKHPQHPYTKALLACVPDAEGKKELKPINYDWLENEVTA
jgi:peptide/nickel transport system ATP-binding protein